MTENQLKVCASMPLPELRRCAVVAVDEDAVEVSFVVVTDFFCDLFNGMVSVGEKLFGTAQTEGL